MMMKKILCGLGLLIAFLSIGACRGGSKVVQEGADTLNLRYARHLTLVEHPEYTEITIRNPWDTLKTLQTCLVGPADIIAKIPLPGATRIATPLKRMAIFTTTHSNLVQELGAIDCIAGICETEYIANKTIKEAINKGDIRDLGSAMTPNREQIIDAEVDAIWTSPYENASTFGNLERLNIPIVQCADYMETSALGRAEWMRMYGRLIGKAAEADSLFAKIEQRYWDIAQQHDKEHKAPTVLFDTKSGSAWYVPGGQSTIAQLVKDAGGDYVFDYTNRTGSVPLSLETVMDKGANAEIWILRYTATAPLTLRGLKTMDNAYALFEAYKQGRVYGCNTTDLIFYEETPFHPERLLEDFYRIFHAKEDEKAEELRYFHRLKEDE